MTTCRKCAESLALIVVILRVTSLSANAQTAFDRVDALSASKAQHQSAQFFRSVYVSDSVGPYGSQRQPGGTMVSLNPKDTNALPVIWDTVTDQFIPSRAPVQPIDGVQILRVLEVSVFNGKYAAASASIHENAGTRVGWGYVDRMGRWVVAPRYDYADMPINGWAKVGLGDRRLDKAFVFDLERRKKINLPAGVTLRFDPLVTVGLNAYAWVNDSTKQSPESNLVQLLLDSGTGEFFRPPYPAALIRAQDPTLSLLSGGTSGQNTWAVRNSNQKALIATNLRAAVLLTDSYLVACDQGDNEAPLVRFGNDTDLFPLNKNSKLRCGVLDAQGKWRTTPRAFQQFRLLGDSTLIMRSLKEWCSLDLRTDNSPTCGATIPAAMLSAGLMLDVSWKSLAETQEKPGIYGYRDALGDLKIPLQFERATPFAGEIAAVRQFDVPGLINANGTWLTPPPPAHIGTLTQQRDSISSSRSQDGRLCRECFGVIDRTGKWVLPPSYSEGAPGPKQSQFWLRGLGDAPYLLAGVDGVPKAYGGNRFLEKLRPLVSPGSASDVDAIIATSINGKWGLADGDEKWVLKPQFEDLKVVSPTRAIVQSKGKWGMISVSGEWVIPAVHNNLNILNDWFVAACTKDGESCTTFTADGKKTAQVLQLSSIAPFDAKGYASAQDKVTALWGYLNRHGSWAVEPKYLKAYSFNGDYALVQQPQTDGDVTANAFLPKGPEDFFTSYVALWPASRLAVVTSTPSSWIAQTLKPGQRWYSESQQFPTVVSLIDTEGRLLVPKAAFWKSAP
nr:WG repeat-containing protein [Rhodoferax sp.]